MTIPLDSAMETPAPPPTRTVRLSSDRVFLFRVCLSAWLLRLAIVLVFQATDAIRILRLSPDSERYHREGLWIMEEMGHGYFNWPNWIDNGWFQFTGLVYWILWPSPLLMQLLNITFSTLTVIPLFLVAKRMTQDIRVQRFYALLVAFFPSFVYWSCLMLKDPVSILALALVIYGVVELRQKWRWRPLLLLAAGLLIYVGTRAYLFMVLVMLMPAAFLLFPKKKLPLRAFILPAVIGLIPMAFGYGYFASGAFSNSMYFDLDYINRVRTAMGDHGHATLFNASDVHVWGQDIVADIFAAIRTLLAVFIPVNPFEVSSTRQMMAAPLVFVMGYVLFLCVPGGLGMWRARRVTIPVIIFAAAVLAVYVSGTTNAGALFRWTTQVMPYILLTATFGLFLRNNALASGATRLVRFFSRQRGSRITHRRMAA